VDVVGLDADVDRPGAAARLIRLARTHEAGVSDLTGVERHGDARHQVGLAVVEHLDERGAGPADPEELAVGAEDIAHRDDADQPPVVIDDGERPDTVTIEEQQRVVQRRIARQGDRGTAHDALDPHLLEALELVRAHRGVEGRRGERGAQVAVAHHADEATGGVGHGEVTEAPPGDQVPHLPQGHFRVKTHRIRGH
jgi:hypothetical protein